MLLYVSNTCKNSISSVPSDIYRYHMEESIIWSKKYDDFFDFTTKYFGSWTWNHLTNFCLKKKKHYISSTITLERREFLSIKKIHEKKRSIKE